MLLLAGSFLDTEKTKSELESRNLHTIPKNPLLQRREFESYISDHFPFREKLLATYFSLNLKLPSTQAKNIVGEDNWIFAIKNPEGSNLPVLKSYQNYNLLTVNEINQIIKNLKKFKKWCDDNNIKLYLLFPPDKNRVYARFMPKFILRKQNKSPVEQLKMQIPTEFNVIPLEKELIELSLKSNDLLYYKEESHWSETGAFFAYQELMKKITQDFPFLKPLSTDDFYITKTITYRPYDAAPFPQFGKGNQYIPRLFHKTTLYNHFVYKNKQDIQIHWDQNFKNSTYSKGQELNVYIIGDSYACYLHPFLSATFKRVRSHRFNMPREPWGIQFNKQTAKFNIEKPDILILSVSDLKLKDLLRIN